MAKRYNLTAGEGEQPPDAHSNLLAAFADLLGAAERVDGAYEESMSAALSGLRASIADARMKLTAFPMPSTAVHCDVVFDREAMMWSATSDLGHVARADFQVRAALECFALRLGIAEAEATCPLSVGDPTAQDLLWEYAQRKRSVDPAFADGLEAELGNAGFRLDTWARAIQERVEAAFFEHGVHWNSTKRVEPTAALIDAVVLAVLDARKGSLTV